MSFKPALLPRPSITTCVIVLSLAARFPKNDALCQFAQETKTSILPPHHIAVRRNPFSIHVSFASGWLVTHHPSFRPSRGLQYRRIQTERVVVVDVVEWEGEKNRIVT